MARGPVRREPTRLRARDRDVNLAPPAAAETGMLADTRVGPPRLTEAQRVRLAGALARLLRSAVEAQDVRTPRRRAA